MQHQIDSYLRNETLRWRIETISGGASQLEIYSRLVLDRADPNYNGLYECEVTASDATATNSLDHGHPQRAGGSGAGSQLASSVQQASQLASNEQLRRLFGLSVNGK